MADDVPITYVPLRNTFFLTLGAALLESAALHAIEREGAAPTDLEATLFIAANALDYSGYPDCRPEFYTAAVETLRLGSKLGTQYGVSFTVQTPIIDRTKADIVRLALEVGAPLEYTWSCYEGGARPCGRCDSCLLRAKGYAEANTPDPALAVA
jgi:7-cyano-7-deazaguanine synthase